MKNYILPLFIILIFHSLPCAAIEPQRVQQAVNMLDQGLERRSDYIGARQHRIDSLEHALGERKGHSAPLLMEIADAYTSFNNDSALVYLSKGIESCTGEAAMPFRWKLAKQLPLAGFLEKAVDEFNSINADSVPREWLASYYDAGRQMHSYIAAFFTEYPDAAAPHRKKALEFQEKLLDVLPKSSNEYKHNLGEYYLLTDRREMAKVLLEEVVNEEPPESNLRAKAAHHLSTIAKEDNDADSYLYYLSLSALADVKSATREVVALQELGSLLYQNGDISRAYRYLSHALENAVECGAPLRMVDTARLLPIIEHAHSAHIASWRRTIYWIMAAMGVLLLGLVLTLFLLRREMQKMKVLQANLRAANNAKEVYISQFLQLCSIYMDKLNQFCKIATRKLAAGQSDELYRMTKSGKFIEEQSHESYEVFDNAFLHIYPDFLTHVNALLRPDARIELKPGEMLNTDLRILAFMRLGIEESTRIAQVLNYSLNTIYSYRNRLKARALDKENFEKNVMNIPSVS